jgi:ribokinase
VVIVVGSLNADLVFRVHRLPHRGETVGGATLSRSQGGKGANQAAAAALLGARTWMVGRVGDDAPGEEAVGSLRGLGVECSQVGRGRHATGLAAIVVDGHGENMIAVAPGANAELDPEAVTRALHAVAQPGGVVLACLEVPLDAVHAAATAARKLACGFVLNPAPARPVSDELLGLCDVLTPNEHEVAGLGVACPEELLERGAAAVVVTRGREGASLYRTGKPTFRQAAFGVAAVDSTGAGDAFSATLVWALASGRRLEDAVRLAAAGGALATRGLGARAALATSSEVERLARRSDVDDAIHGKD